MLPEDWKKRSVAEVCRSVSVGVVIKPSQYYVSASEGIKAFRSANVKEGQVNNSDWVYFSHKGHNENKKSELKTGDVLVVRTGYPGTACVVTPQYAGCNAIDVVIARPDIQKIIPTYLCLFTNSEYGKSQVANLQGGMAQKHLNVGAYQQVEIPLPPLPEQKKIAAILSTWDRAIDGTEKLLANSQQQKKALMQQLLTGKKRLSGFTGEWKVNRLGEIYSSFTGLSGKTKNDFGSGYKYITYKNVFLNSCVNIKDIEYVEIKTNENQNKLQYGDILFTTSSETPEEVGMSSVFLYGGNDIFYLNSFCFGFRPKNSLVMNPNFSQFLFRGEEIRRKIQLLAQGATRYNISKNKLSEISLNLPPLPEQKAIAAVLSTSDEEITALESDLARLRQEKKALMQQLLTGKRRVTVD
ncbi:restriction endonuclease subunit S [Acetobacter cerevisiae]|nr:restriction endonuclease subunit S [Acetobacter cerevisiae]